MDICGRHLKLIFSQPRAGSKSTSLISFYSSNCQTFAPLIMPALPKIQMYDLVLLQLNDEYRLHERERDLRVQKSDY